MKQNFRGDKEKIVLQVNKVYSLSWSNKMLLVIRGVIYITLLSRS